MSCVYHENTMPGKVHSIIQCVPAPCLDSCHNAHTFPDSKVHGANMMPIWGRQDPGGPHVGGHMNFAIWVLFSLAPYNYGLVQECNIPSALATEIPCFCYNP